MYVTLSWPGPAPKSGLRAFLSGESEAVHERQQDHAAHDSNNDQPRGDPAVAEDSAPRRAAAQLSSPANSAKTQPRTSATPGSSSLGRSHQPLSLPKVCNQSPMDTSALAAHKPAAARTATTDKGNPRLQPADLAAWTQYIEPVDRPDPLRHKPTVVRSTQSHHEKYGTDRWLYFSCA